MNFCLKNAQLTATLNAHGAELCSLIDQEGTQYIWTADPTYWARHTPILFPLVGKLVGNAYTYEGNTYALGAHGFARDRVFEVVDQSETSITFQLTSDAESLKVYPFAFALYVSYTLVDKTLQIGYKVDNTDTKEIGFKLGAHPGFRCPLSEGESFQDYVLSLEKEETPTFLPITPDVYLTGEQTTYLTQHTPVTHKLFEKGALILTDYTSTWMALRSTKSSKGIRIGFEGFPYLGIWSPENNPSPFLCIEPWMSLPDAVDAPHALMEKESVIKLPIGETFSCMHSMTIL